jgi:hypothetical protein
VNLDTLWILLAVAGALVAMSAVFALVATVAELALRLPEWAARRLWRRARRW